MRGDDAFRREEDPEELRAVLREWVVPGAPAEIAARLRRTHALHRAARRRRWLTLAAALGVLAVGLWRASTTQAPGSRTAVRQPEPTAAPSTRATARATPTAVAAVSRETRPLAAEVRTIAPPVLVEPGQPERLRRLARRLRDAEWVPSADGPGPTGVTLEMAAIDVRPIEVRSIRVPPVGEPPPIVVVPIPFREEPRLDGGSSAVPSGGVV
jgi:hypothetical protein